MKSEALEQEYVLFFPKPVTGHITGLRLLI